MRKVLCLMLIAIMLLSVGCSAAVSVVDANINDDGNLILSMSDGSTIDAGYAKGDKGDQGEKGIDGKDGSDGIDGVDGVGIKKAAVNDSGHLMIRLTDDTLMDTGYVIGADGKDGRDGIDGRDGRDGADGKDGTDGNDGEDGADGIDGIDGKTPYIGDNGNWWIGEEDTGVEAESTDFIYSNKGEGTILVAYVGNDYDVVIPEKTTSIGNGAFAGNKVINTVKIPQNVEFIGDGAFENCINLCTITLPDGLLSIGDRAFAGCKGLEGTSENHPFSELLTLPDSLIMLGDEAFSGCSSLYKVFIPANLLKSNNNWGTGTFSDCSFLKSVSFGGGGYIPNDTFANCTGLDSISIPEGITSIGSRVFYNCTNLTAVVLPETLQYIGSYAFYNCRKLESVNLPESLRHIDDYAFYASPAIKGELRLTSTKIGDYAFFGCVNIESLRIMYNEVLTNSDHIEIIGEGAFESCISLETVTIITNIDEYQFSATDITFSIGDKAFYNCSSLTGYSQQTDNDSGLHVDWVIGDEVFRLTAIKKLALLDVRTLTINALPDGIEEIILYGMNGSVCRLVGEGSLPSTLEKIFVVPAESVNAYKAADGWKDYATKIQEIPQDPNVIVTPIS